MTEQYKVVAACLVHVPISTERGPALGTLYAGDLVPPGVPAGKLDFWLSGGMIAPVGGNAPQDQPSGEPEEPEGSGRGSGETATPPPESGPGSAKAAWVDYAVAQGMSRDDAQGMDRADLIKALKGE